MKQHWHKNTETSWFRDDMVYAGKDHTKPNSKTFICINHFYVGEEEEKRGFKTLEEAIDKADELWPFMTKAQMERKLIKDEKCERQRLGID